VAGEVQKEGRVIHVVCKRLWDLTPWLGRLDAPETAPVTIRSRNFQ